MTASDKKFRLAVLNVYEILEEHEFWDGVARHDLMVDIREIIKEECKA